MKWKAQWIKPMRDYGDVVPVFIKHFQIRGKVTKAVLYITAMGVYEATINGQRVSDYVLAPGWTTYYKRLQYQEYDVTELIEKVNRLSVFVGKGWYRSNMSGKMLAELKTRPCGIIGELRIEYEDGQKQVVYTDDSWEVSESEIRFSEIYDGEICDARFTVPTKEHVEIFEGPSDTLIAQEGAKILEQERIATAQILKTSKGETVIDFGQEVTGYVEVTVDAKAGDVVSLSHGEMLDKDGNFYNENYRAAKAQFVYICKEGKQTYHPRLTFYGFRYIRVEEFPGGLENVKPEHFQAIVVHSDIKRTGYLRCSNPLLNKFFDNVIWGQKGNFLDIPTDCPQRNERLGWTGDAQVFIKAAAYNYDVEQFFSKWLGDLRADQTEDGYVPQMVPDSWHFEPSVAGWGDAALICPWELYLTYGNKEILKVSFESMKKRVDYITNMTQEENLWTGCKQQGDWLALDGENGSWRGGSREDFVASAFYAYSTALLVKTGKILREDIAKYEALYMRIVQTFKEKFPTYHTQTECVLAVHFGLTKNPQATADQLAEMIRKNNTHLTTGFLGTPYLLHVLSDYGYADLSYDLLLQDSYPSWLYEVSHGATTVWEHWNGLKEDGSFQSPNMNSFNHYAYGAVVDWVYGVAGGIKPLEDAPGYQKVIIAPIPNERLEWLDVTLETRQGQICSKWKKEEAFWQYEITTPVEAEVVIAGNKHRINAGTYYFYSERKEGGRI